MPRSGPKPIASHDKAEAAELGDVLLVEEVPNVEPLTHQAFAAPRLGGQATMGRPLASGTSAAEAAEAGVDVLRGIVEQGKPWPE